MEANVWPPDVKTSEVRSYLKQAARKSCKAQAGAVGSAARDTNKRVTVSPRKVAANVSKHGKVNAHGKENRASQ